MGLDSCWSKHHEHGKHMVWHCTLKTEFQISSCTWMGQLLFSYQPSNCQAWKAHVIEHWTCWEMNSAKCCCGCKSTIFCPTVGVVWSTCMKFGMVIIFVVLLTMNPPAPPRAWKKRKEKRTAPFFVFTLFPFSSPSIGIWHLLSWLGTTLLEIIGYSCMTVSI